MLAFAVAVLGLSQSALSQEPSLSLETAKQRFDEGAKAYEAEDYEAARVAYAQAYALEPIPELLANLGHAELRTGRYVEAARHISQFLRESQIGDGPERGAARRGLLEAEAHVGRVQVTADVDGADVTIDGEPVGTTPLVYAWYVEPGEHRVQAIKPGFGAARSVFGISAGKAKNIKLTLIPIDEDEEAQPSQPFAPPQELDEPATSDTPAASSKPSIGIILAGAGVAIVGIGAGVGFLISADNKRSERDAQLSSLQETYGPNPCAISVLMLPECATVEELDEDAGTRNTLGIIGLGVGGAAAVATTLYALWPRSEQAQALAGTRTVAIVPMLGQNGGGVGIHGLF